jgi:transglutaminase-like putative cysteine protease
MEAPGQFDASGSSARWTVGCHLGIEVVEAATLVLHVAPARVPGLELDETLEVVLDGKPLAVRAIEGHHGGRIHVVRSPPGALTVDLQATVRGGTGALAPSPPSPSAIPPALDAGGLDLDQLTYLRQSRYCPSDVLGGFAAYELGHLEPGPELLAAVVDWVGSRLTYEGGSSGPLDTAVDSLFRGRGVCRDFAHLAIAMLRTFDVPARLVAVYAPGLSPMDFHAVVEAYVDGGWWVLDPTRLAPRPTLLRIATGRDAADTAFLTVIDGEAPLQTAEVVAFTEGDLPEDDHTGLVSLPPAP